MKNLNREKLEYRKGVQAIIYRKGKILITQEIQWKDNEWGFPGGTVESNESVKEAIERELIEEFPNNIFLIIKKSNIVLKYEWPDEMIKDDIKIKGKSYRGQMKTQFQVKLLGDDILSYKQDEIKKVKWVNVNALSKYLIFPNQLDITLQTLRDLEILK